MAKVNPIPMAGPSPYIAVKGADKAIEFYKKVFDANEIMVMHHEGRVGHAELQINGRAIYLADEYPDMGFVSPASQKGHSIMLHIYVENVDDVFARALKLGAKSLTVPADQFYGDRGGKLEDPFGHLWWISTHKEDLSDEEIQERMSKMKDC